MIFPTIIVVAVVLTCLAGQAFFSGSEMAMVSADREALQTRAAGGDYGAELSLTLLEREDRLLGTCLIGTNLTLVTATTLVAMVLGWWHVELGLGAALVYTPVALIFGETLSKTVFQFHATRLAPLVSRPLRVAQVVFMPALAVVGVWSTALDALLGRGKREPVRREEIVDLLGDGGDGGEIDDEERRLIRNVFVLSETPVDEVMTPLVDLMAVPLDANVASATRIAGETGHSRLPVYEERIDNIVGLVHVRALLFEDDPEAPIAPMMEPVTFVPESKRVDDLLTEMRQRRDPLAVVVDEYGGSVGLVTIEDLLEEVIGEIRDERDAAEPDLLQLSEREWRVPARTEMDDLADALDATFPEGDFETVAGLILSRAGRIPAVGETIKVGRYTFFIEEATERAVLSVRLLLPPD